MTWNIHGGRDAPLDQIALEIEAQHADVICLNEVRRPHGRALGRALSMRSFVTSSRLGPYSNAILTGLPVSSWKRLKFAGVRRVDRRDAAIVTLEGGVTIAAVHLNLRAAERVRNIRQLIDALPDRSIIAGDLNETQGGRVWPVLAERFFDACDTSNVPTFPAGAPRQRLDYIWVLPGTHVERSDVIATRSSDHRAVVVTVDVS